MDTSKRLKLLIYTLRLNVTSFSKEIGLNNNVTILRIVKNEGNGPSYKTTFMIKSRYPKVNLNWLLFDQGPMWLDLNTWEDEPESSSETKKLDLLIKKQLNNMKEEEDE